MRDFIKRIDRAFFSTMMKNPASTTLSLISLFFILVMSTRRSFGFFDYHVMAIAVPCWIISIAFFIREYRSND